jgi:hypothetical protein
MVKRSLSIWLVAIAVMAVTNTEMGSSGASTTTRATAATQYRNDLLPLVKALETFSNEAAKDTSSTGFKTAEAQARPLEKAFVAYGRLLSHQSWPVNVRADVQSNLAATATVIKNFQSLKFLKNARQSAIASWAATTKNSLHSWEMATLTVERDFGFTG